MIYEVVRYPHVAYVRALYKWQVERALKDTGAVINCDLPDLYMTPTHTLPIQAQELREHLCPVAKTVPAPLAEPAPKKARLRPFFIGMWHGIKCKPRPVYGDERWHKWYDKGYTLAWFICGGA